MNRGFRNCYQFVGKKDYESEALKWGYLSSHLRICGMKVGVGASVYTDALEVIQKKENFFVISSNGDDLFERNSFPVERVYTPQGSFRKFQCSKPCSQESWWDATDQIVQMSEHVDRETQLLKDESLIPKCAKCNGNVTVNLRGGSYFLETPQGPNRKRYENFVQHLVYNNSKVLILDVGSGFNTPTVIRFRFVQAFRTS